MLAYDLCGLSQMIVMWPADWLSLIILLNLHRWWNIYLGSIIFILGVFLSILYMRNIVIFYEYNNYSIDFYWLTLNVMQVFHLALKSFLVRVHSFSSRNIF